MEFITQFLTQMLSAGQAMSFGHVFVAIAVAYFGGVLSSLTPCIYPMIPITVSVVGGIGPSRRPWRQVVIRATAYVLGMTLIYSFLGVLAGISGKVFGTLTNHSGWYLGIGVVMSIAALIMLDVLPFEPAVWWETFKRKVLHRRKSPSASTPLVREEMTLAGAFFLGASSGLIAAPCTTPVLTSILAFIASTQSVGMGFLLMLSFSFGLGTLLILIAVFAGAIQILPRSGNWMKAVKLVSGLILLAFAEYLIYRAGCSGGT